MRNDSHADAQVNNKQSTTTKSKGNNSTSTDINNVNTTGDAIGVVDGYVRYDKGPFFVMMDKPDINEYEVGKLLSTLRFKDLPEIVKISRNTVRVKCRDYHMANKLLQNKSLVLDGFKLFIPSLYANTVGIARGVPLEWTEEEIMENSVCGSRIIKIERMNYWNADLQRALPSKSIKVTFRSFSLPSEMKIYSVLSKLDLFIPKPLFCKNCLRYGHTMKFCKMPTLCQNCTSTEHSVNCKDTAACKYCSEEPKHPTKNTACPEKAVQIEIKKVMTTEKIPFAEASKVVRKKKNEQKFKNEEKKKEASMVTLKSQVESNEKMLNDIAKAISSRKSDSLSDNSAALMSIQGCIYGYMVRNGLIDTNSNDGSTSIADQHKKPQEQ